jgi:hypothetical protein
MEKKSKSQVSSQKSLRNFYDEKNYRFSAEREKSFSLTTKITK